MTDDLVQFLRDRLDEDMALARKAAGRKQGGDSWTFEEVSVRAGDGSLVLRHTWADEGAHIVRHDPARVLREVEAKRLVVRLHEDSTTALMAASGTVLAGGVKVRRRAYEDVLKLLALPYADHPDYREEWRL